MTSAPTISSTGSGSSRSSFFSLACGAGAGCVAGAVCADVGAGTFGAVVVACVLGGAALAAVFGMLALNGLPRLHHPVFNAPRFSLASRNRFFFCIEADDPRFDHERVARFLASLDPCEVMDVER